LAALDVSNSALGKAASGAATLASKKTSKR
jgi:hypothetical protein